MSRVSWLKLLLFGRGNTLLHHHKLLVFSHWLNLVFRGQTAFSIFPSPQRNTEKSGLATRDQVEPASIRVHTYIQAKLAHMTCYTISNGI